MGSKVTVCLTSHSSSWGRYAKLSPPGFQSLDRIPWRAGIPRDWTSDLEKFEGLDPAEWCPRGYAIVNVDSRGVFDSDGDMFMLGTQVRTPYPSIINDQRS